MHLDRGTPHRHQRLLSLVVQGQWVVLNLEKSESDSEFHRMPRNDLEDAKELQKAFPTFSQAGSRLRASLRVMHAHSDLSTLIAHVD